MNILLLSAHAERVGVALCVATGTPELALEGRVVSGATTHVELREPNGPLLHSTDLAAGLAAGVTAVLDWFETRKIRVDAVCHQVGPLAHQDTMLRLSSQTKTMMGGNRDCPKGRCVRAVTAWSEACPQYLRYTHEPENLAALAAVLVKTRVLPPADCPKKLKVRCDACVAS